MTPSGDAGRAIVHVGLRKTGTSFLQSHLWGSPDQLARRGIRLVPSTRERAVVLMWAIRGRLEDPARAARAFDRFATEVREAPEPTLVLTQESLAGASAEQARRLLSCFQGREVHLVVTARDLARQLPSAWQQRVKADFDDGFGEFLEAVRSRHGGGGRGFWEQQDLVDVLARWAGDLPPERVHVVTVPPGSDRSALPQRFGSVLGVDFAELRSDAVRSNASIDPAQVEVLRRLNRLRPLEERRERSETVKNFFVAQVLAPRRGTPARTPVELRDWCREQGERQIEALRRGGYDVVGDLDDLLPRDEDFGPMTEVPEAEVARVAVQAIADLLVRHHGDAHELAELRSRVQRLEAAAQSASSGAGRVRRWRRGG